MIASGFFEQIESSRYVSAACPHDSGVTQDGTSAVVKVEQLFLNLQCLAAPLRNTGEQMT